MHKKILIIFIFFHSYLSVAQITDPHKFPVKESRLGQDKHIQGKVTISRCDLVYGNGEGYLIADLSKLESIQKSDTSATLMPMGLKILFKKTSARDKWAQKLIEYIPICKSFQSYWDKVLSYDEVGPQGISVAPNACHKIFEAQAMRGIERLRDILSSQVVNYFDGLPIGRKLDGIFPVRYGYLGSGHAVDLMRGPESFAKRIELIDRAQKRIYITTFHFGADKTTKLIAEKLIQASLRGVQVIMLTDNFNSLMHFWSRAEVDALYNRMLSAGVIILGHYGDVAHQVKEQIKYSKKKSGKLLENFHLATHEKAMLVDDVHSIVGGMNISSDYFAFEGSPKKHWEDLDVYMLSSEIAQDLAESTLESINHFIAERGDPRSLKQFNPHTPGTAAFEKFYLENKGPDPEEKDLVAPPEVAASTLKHATSARLVRSRPLFGESHIDELIHQMILRAKKEIWIINLYFNPSESLLQALKKAVARGVRVNIVTNHAGSSPVNLNPLSQYGRGLYFDVMSTNPSLVRIFEYTGKEGDEKVMKQIHTKSIFIDDRFAHISSFNIDHVSSHSMVENSLNIDSQDLVRQFKQEFLIPRYLRLSNPPITFDQAVEFKRSRFTQWLRHFKHKF